MTVLYVYGLHSKSRMWIQVAIFLMYICDARRAGTRNKSFPDSFFNDVNAIFHDGILIKEKGEVRVTDGVWSVFVTIKRPEIMGIDIWIANITDTLGSFEAKWPEGMLESWKYRINNIRRRADLTERALPSGSMGLPDHFQIANQFPFRTRKRRALFGFIGALSRQLFGTAEDSDVQEIKSHVKEAMSRQNVLYHNIRSLITVVNASKTAIESMSKHIYNVTEKAIKQLQAAENETIQDQIMLKEKIKYIEASMIINEDIQRMEELVHRYTAKVQHFNLMRAELERAKLSRNLLSESHLKEIAANMAVSKMKPPSANWIYTNSMIHSVTEMESQLVYALLIPSLSDDTFEEFELSSFKTPLNISYEFTKEIKTRQRMAINYKGTLSFEVTDKICHGEKPVVCVPISVTEGKEVCEVQIVMENLRPSCEFTIMKRPEELTADIVRLQYDQMLISPLVENLVITTACEQERELGGEFKRKFKTQSVSKVHVQDTQEHCEYSAGGHMFKGLKSSHFNLYVRPAIFKRRKAIQVTFDKALLKKTRNYLSKLKSLSIKIPDLNVIEDPLPPIPWRKDTHLLELSLMALGIVLLLILVIYCVYKGYKCKGRKCNDNVRGVLAVGESKAEQATPPPHSPENNDDYTTAIQNIYPNIEHSAKFGFMSGQPLTGTYVFGTPGRNTIGIEKAATKVPQTIYEEETNV